MMIPLTMAQQQQYRDQEGPVKPDTPQIHDQNDCKPAWIQASKL